MAYGTAYEGRSCDFTDLSSPDDYEELEEQVDWQACLDACRDANVDQEWNCGVYSENLDGDSSCYCSVATGLVLFSDFFGSATTTSSFKLKGTVS